MARNDAPVCWLGDIKAPVFGLAVLMVVGFMGHQVPYYYELAAESLYRQEVEEWAYGQRVVR